MLGAGKAWYIDQKAFPAIFTLSVERQLPDTALQNKPGTRKILTQHPSRNPHQKRQSSHSRAFGMGLHSHGRCWVWAKPMFTLTRPTYRLQKVADLIGRVSCASCCWWHTTGLSVPTRITGCIRVAQCLHNQCRFLVLINRLLDVGIRLRYTRATDARASRNWRSG